jgi:hypothetical protein
MHNSIVLSVDLAEDIHASVAGDDDDAKQQAITRLRRRIRDEAKVDAPGWIKMRDTKQVNGTVVSNFKRKIDGNFTTVKTMGVVNATPKEFVQGIMDFDQRSTWDQSFNEGVVVEPITGKLANLVAK